VTHLNLCGPSNPLWKFEPHLGRFHCSRLYVRVQGHEEKCSFFGWKWKSNWENQFRQCVWKVDLNCEFYQPPSGRCNFEWRLLLFSCWPSLTDYSIHEDGPRTVYFRSLSNRGWSTVSSEIKSIATAIDRHLCYSAVTSVSPSELQPTARWQSRLLQQAPVASSLPDLTTVIHWCGDHRVLLRPRRATTIKLSTVSSDFFHSNCNLRDATTIISELLLIRVPQVLLNKTPSLFLGPPIFQRQLPQNVI